MNQRNKSPILSSNKNNLILIHKRRKSNIEKNNLFIIKLNLDNSKNPINQKETILTKILSFNKNNKIPSIITLEKQINKKFKQLYSHNKNFYNIKVINKIICSENSHIVAEFKDYLIKSDYSEFLQKNYSLYESRKWLPKIFEYYENYSVIFPNYFILPESKYIFKRIQKKQKVINKLQELEEEREKIKNGLIKIYNNDNLVFNTIELNSILNQTDTSGIKFFFGLKKQDSSKNISLENLINKISDAENKIKKNKEKKLNYALKKNKILKKTKLTVNINTNDNNYKNKGRNYKRYLDNGFNVSNSNNKSKRIYNNTGLNINSTTSNGMKNTKVSSITMEMDSKFNTNNNNINNSNNTIYIYSNTKNNSKNYNNNKYNHNNTINLNNSLKIKKFVSNHFNKYYDKNFIIKVFNEIKKSGKIRNNSLNLKKNINRNINKNFSSCEKSNSKRRISESIKQKRKLSYSSSSPNNGRINSFKKTNILKKENKILKPKHKRVLSYNFSNKNKFDIILKNNKIKDNSISLTERNSKKKFNKEITQIITSKLNNINSNKKISIPLNNKIYNSLNDNNKKEIRENKKNKTNSTKNNIDFNMSSNYNNFYQNNRIKLNIKSENSQCFSKSPNKDYNKIIKTFGHFNSYNFGMKRNNSRNNKIKKQSNQQNINGIKIKRFKEIFHNTNINSRNNSERIIISETWNCKINRSNRINSIYNKNDFNKK